MLLRHKLTTVALVCSAALAACTSASAKVWDLSQPEHQPIFIGGGLGFGSAIGSGLGINAYGGFSFNQNIAAEGDMYITPAYHDGDHAYTVAGLAKFSFPLPSTVARHWIPYALGGLAFTHWPHDGGTKLGLALGGGVDYRVQRNFEVGAKLLGAISDDSPVILVATAAYRL